MLFYAIQILASLFASYYYRNNRLRYFTVITVAYFISFYFSGSFDIALTLYCILIIIGVGRSFSVRLTDFLFALWLLIYFIIGIVFQDSFSTISSFVTRYGFLFICLYINFVKTESFEWIATESDFRFAVRIGLLTEFLIILLVWSSEGIGTRVVTNNQPIGAGMAIALITIIGWCYLKKQFTANETILYSILCTLIVLLSGTRGYMVIVSLGMFAILCMYLLDIPGNGEKMCLRIGLFLILISILLVWILIIDHGESVVRLLRLDASLGYRENENIYVKGIMKIAPWYNQLFGFGMAGTANHIEGFLSIVQQASQNRDWMFRKLLNKTIYHNYWYTILFQQGIIGLIIVFMFFINLMKRIITLKTDSWFKFLLFMLILGNMISQAYRITATCAVFELLIIMFFIRMIESMDALGEKEKGCHLS